MANDSYILHQNTDTARKRLTDARQTISKPTSANGAEAAKISGAGGGGFMMLYCDPRNRMQLIRALKKTDGTTMTPSFYDH
jgi:galactokinase/mevalonate kinase-like predicted kinase